MMSRLMIRLSALLIALAAAGCGTNYQHPTKDQAEFQRDLYDCERDAAPQVDPIYRRRMMDRCLRLRGWQPT